LRARLKTLRDGLSGVAHATRSTKRLILLGCDATASALALLVSVSLLHGSLATALTNPAFLTLLPTAMALAAVFSWALGLPYIKLKSFESVAVLKTAAMAALTTVAVALWALIAGAGMAGIGIILFGLLLFLQAVGYRVMLLHLLSWTLRQGTATRVVIYGAGKTGIELAAALRSGDDVQVVAFVDDSPALQAMTVSGLRVYPPGKIAKLAAERNVSRVLLAMPSLSPPKIARIARSLRNKGLDVQNVPSFAQIVGTEEATGGPDPVEPKRLLARSHMADALPDGRDLYRGRNIFVSGAGGSIGAELCRQIVACRPARLVLFEVSEAALYQIDRELADAATSAGVILVPVLGSVTDSRLCRATLLAHEIEIIFHAAAYKHVPLVEANPLAGVANNVLGTRALADAAIAAGVARVVLISTDKAVRPTNVMGASKRLAEMVIQDLSRRAPATVFSMVRFGNVLGSSGSVVPLFAEQIARGGPVTLTHNEVTRFFMTVQEAVSLVLVAGSFSSGDNQKGGDVYVLDMGKPVRIRDLAERMIHDAGYTVRDTANPVGDIEIVVTGLRPGEKLHEELLIGEGLLTTPHPRILRAREDCASELDMATSLARLRVAIGQGDAQAALQVLDEVVEGYDRQDAQAQRRHA
jgi:FlaA1/EpsC-like NDP-sugar epimerase